jgi:light-regulated signal transduction histidine kinase (bacteriophytochrome)
MHFRFLLREEGEDGRDGYLPEHLIESVVSNYLTSVDLGRLDSAVTQKSLRPNWLSSLRLTSSKTHFDVCSYEMGKLLDLELKESKAGSDAGDQQSNGDAASLFAKANELINENQNRIDSDETKLSGYAVSTIR